MENVGLRRSQMQNTSIKKHVPEHIPQAHRAETEKKLLKKQL